MAIRANLFAACARLAAAVLLCLATATPFSPAAAQHVVVMVNGVPITSLDIKFRSRLIQLSTRKKPTQKEVLEELIDATTKVMGMILGAIGVQMLISGVMALVRNP